MSDRKMRERIKAQRNAEQRAWDDWQANPVPSGAPVEVTKDDGTKVVTKTRSAPWKLGDGTPVVMVDGISGGYLLTRVRVLPWDGNEATL
jgi:hypothetical protein